jgi:hypothetical protein
MKRTWYFDKYYTNKPFSWALIINPPHEDDYFKNQWSVIITFFGWNISFGTWEKENG